MLLPTSKADSRGADDTSEVFQNLAAGDAEDCVRNTFGHTGGS